MKGLHLIWLDPMAYVITVCFVDALASPIWLFYHCLVWYLCLVDWLLSLFSSSPILWPRMWLPVTQVLRFICWRKPSRILFKPEFMCSTVSWCGQPCVCECVFEVDEGVCVGCWTGWAMWLSCHGPPSGMKLIIFLFWSIVEMQSVFFLYLPANWICKKKCSQTMYQLKW